MRKKDVYERINSIKLNEPNKQGIIAKAFEGYVPSVAKYYKRPNKWLATCGCCGHVFDTGEPPEKPNSGDGDVNMECPSCHTMLCVTHYGNPRHFNQTYLAMTTENHEGIDFIRYWWCDWRYDSNHGKWTHAFEAFRLVYYTDDGVPLLYRRIFRGPEYCWYFKEYDPLICRHGAPTQKEMDKLALGAEIYGDIDLTERFHNSHIKELFEIGCGCWLMDWVLTFMNEGGPLPKCETILELKKGFVFSQAMRNINHMNPENFLELYWPQLKMAFKRNYKITQMWFDEIDLLRDLGLSDTKPENLFPKNLKKVHDEHLKKYWATRPAMPPAQTSLKNVEEAEKAFGKKYAKHIAPYANVRLTGPGVEIVPMLTIADFFENAEKLQNCFVTSRYWQVEDYIMFLCKDGGGRVQEVLTVSKRKRKIEFLLGKNNKFSRYHKKFQYLAEQGMKSIISGKPFSVEAFPESTDKWQETFQKVAAEQNLIPSIIHNQDRVWPNIFFKKAFCLDGNEVIVCLKKPEVIKENDLGWKQDGGSAKTLREALVIAIYSKEGIMTDLIQAASSHDRSFIYEVGQTVKPTNRSSHSGIYCFDTFKAAKTYWENMFHPNVLGTESAKA